MANFIKKILFVFGVTIGLLFLSPNARVFALDEDVPAAAEGEKEEYSEITSDPKEPAVADSDITGSDGETSGLDTVLLEDPEAAENLPAEGQILPQNNTEEPALSENPQEPVTGQIIPQNNATEPAEGQTILIPAADDAETVLPLSEESSDLVGEEQKLVKEEVSAEGTAEPAATALLSANTRSVSLSSPENSANEADDFVYIEGVSYTRGTSASYGDIPVYYHYSDAYFRDREEIAEDGTKLENAFIYDESLSSISATAATASWPTRFHSTDEDEYKYMSRNAQDLMRQLGFENIQINDLYESDPEINGVMLIAGEKKVVYNGKEYTLIAIFPDAGTKYPEWPMNIELGEDDYHEGFYYGASEVYLPFLSDYIEKNNISGDIKIWSSSVSRGAGVVNTAGGLLDMAIDEEELSRYLPAGVTLEKKNMYFYTFGCPSTVSKDITWIQDDNGKYIERKTDFNNIHSLLNAYDFVLQAVGDEWDMDVFGDKKILSMHGDGMVTEAEFYQKLQEFGMQWSVMSGTAPKNMTYNRDYMFYDEDGFHYMPVEIRSPVTNEDMEDFTASFMENVAPIITREYYKTYLQPALEIFFGTSYDRTGEITEAVKNETNRIMEEVKVKVPELFLKGLITFDFSELREYLNVYVNPLNALPQILINSFRTVGITYNYDFKAYSYSEDLLDDANMRRVIREAGLKAGLGAVDLISRLRLRDVAAAIDVYQAIQLGFTQLSSGHDVALYHAWARTMDDTTLDRTDSIYLKAMTPEDAWGYRMLNLPGNGSYIVTVSDYTNGTGRALYQFMIEDGAVSNVIYSTDPDWFVHVGTGNGGIGKVLYLRPDHNYQISFSAASGTENLGFSVDEWSSHYSYETFLPVNHIIEATDDEIPFMNLAVSSDNNGRSDELILAVGNLKSYPTMQDKGTVEGALADYTIEKLIRMWAVNQVSGNTVESIYQFKKDQSDTYSVTAESIENYQFDGWYLGDTLLTPDPIFRQYLTFTSSGMTITARYHQLTETVGSSAVTVFGTVSSTPEQALTRASKETTIETELPETTEPVTTNSSLQTTTGRTQTYVLEDTESEKPLFTSPAVETSRKPVSVSSGSELPVSYRRTVAPNTADNGMQNGMLMLIGSLITFLAAGYLLLKES